MRALLALRQPKTVVKLGTWHRNEKMPRSAFPLSKSHSYTLGRSYQWCVYDLQGPAGDLYKLLIAFDPGKEQYRGWLGRVVGSDLALLERLEFHPSHKGWHAHIKRGELADVARGVVKEQSQRDRSQPCPAPNIFTVTQLNAVSIAFRMFNVTMPDALEPWLLGDGILF